MSSLWRWAALAAVIVVAGVIVALLASSGTSPESAGSADSAADLSGVDFDPSGWTTDFSRASVPLEEFHSGGPPRDGIPPIDAPRFVDVGDEPVDDREPVVAVERDGQARAYPLQILIWHEIVNDEIAGTPIAVTFCPLCYTAVVFDRRVDSRTLTFGTTGNLRFSDLVMWDRQTETWWQQFSGEAVVGELTGATLTQIPAQLISFGEFRRRHPDGRQLSRRTGVDRSYGDNPYVGYDDVSSPPFLLRDRPLDARLEPKARVVTVEVGDDFLVVPFDPLRRRRVLEEVVGGRPIVVWWRPGTASALGSARISEGDDVGSVAVLDRRAGGRTLRMERAGGLIADTATGTRWDASGRAVSGPLSGVRLRTVPHDTPFWFAVAAFAPDARIAGRAPRQ